jgi:hypothetical protein
MLGDSTAAFTDIEVQRASLASALLRPEFYGEPTAEVESIETHISWVFLTPRLVYKLKKAIDLGFVDYRDPATRRRMCDEEVRLNRRLADDVYLGVTPIARDAKGGFALDGPGEPVDWLVTMRRLAAADAADRRLARGELSEAHVEHIARRLVGFYRECSPARLGASDYRPHFEKRIRDNLAVLGQATRELDAPLVERVHGRQLQFLSLARSEVAARTAAGRIVGGHGDLRPEHVFLADAREGTRCDVIDCVEFSAELRTVDVADELAFLAMEFGRLGAAWAGDTIRRTYEQLSGDAFSDALFRFYQCYRACVRAKVAALRGDQVDVEQRRECRRQADAYLLCADRLSESIARPLVVVVSGLSGTGKSTLASAIAHEWGALWLRTDAIRRRMFGETGRVSGANEGIYDRDARAKVYDAMLDKTGAALAAGQSVVLDGTFLERRFASASLDVARRGGAEAVFVRCWCPREVALERIARRSAGGDSLSDADAEVYRRQVEAAEVEDAAWPSGEAGGGLPLEVDTRAPLIDQVETVMLAIAERD